MSKKIDKIARIQSEVSQSDEEAAKAYISQRQGFQDQYTSLMHTFLSGCARYRPLVEAMLAALKPHAEGNHTQGFEPCDLCNLIARAEALLKENKE